MANFDCVDFVVWNTPEHGHCPALEVRLATVTTAALVTLMATTSSLTMTTTRTSANSLSLAFLLNAAMDIVQVHDGNRLNLF